MASTMTLPSLGVSRRSSVEGKVDRLTPNVPMLILLAHLFDGDGEGICAEPCGNREAMWPCLWPCCRPSGRDYPKPEAAISCASQWNRVAEWLTLPGRRSCRCRGEPVS